MINDINLSNELADEDFDIVTIEEVVNDIETITKKMMSLGNESLQLRSESITFCNQSS